MAQGYYEQVATYPITPTRIAMQQEIVFEEPQSDLTHLQAMPSLFEFNPDESEFIYLLLNGDEIVYVGRSKHLGTRILHHRKGYLYKEYDRTFFFPVSKKDGAELEMALIWALKPFYNKQVHRLRRDRPNDPELLERYGFGPLCSYKPRNITRQEHWDQTREFEERRRQALEARTI